MRKRIFASIIGIFLFGILLFWLVSPKVVNASKVIDLVQSKYRSITINDIYLEAGTINQYLIDDLIPRLSVYKLKISDEELPKEYSFKLILEKNDGTKITIFDNSFILIDKELYKIVDGAISYDKFYNFIK